MSFSFNKKLKKKINITPYPHNSLKNRSRLNNWTEFKFKNLQTPFRPKNLIIFDHDRMYLTVIEIKLDHSQKTKSDFDHDEKSYLFRSDLREKLKRNNKDRLRNIIRRGEIGRSGMMREIPYLLSLG